MTSNVKNGNIYHLGRDGAGGSAVCQNKRAHMSVGREQFKLRANQCKRCAALLAKWEAKRQPQLQARNLEGVS